MPEHSPEIGYWVAFSCVRAVGRVRIGNMLRHFGSLEKAWAATPADLRAAGLEPSVTETIVETRARIDPGDELAKVEGAGLQVLTWSDAAYPRLLREIDDLPPVLYVRGDLLPQDERSITIVGTRKPTAYGRQAAHSMATDLVNAGLTIVSGLARGIDGIAHEAALAAGGRTIGIMGSGLDVIYPPEHRRLVERIVQNGALLSEYPLGVRPDSRHFPRRNRLLSGMTLGTLIIEAGELSGARSTVTAALEQGREVFCVPGSIYSPASKLTNLLIREGAKMVTEVEDVLEELNINRGTEQPKAVQTPLILETPDEAQLMDALSMEPLHVDELSRETGMQVVSVTSTLAVMELRGLVRQVGRMNYVRVEGEVAAAYPAVASTQPAEVESDSAN